MSSLTQIPPTPAQKVAAFREGRGRSEPYALAIVTRVVGAAACRVGDRYLVTREGDLIGVVGGGCMRSALRTAGLAAIAEGEPRHVRVIPKEHDGTPPDPAVRVRRSFGLGAPGRRSSNTVPWSPVTDRLRSPP